MARIARPHNQYDEPHFLLHHVRPSLRQEGKIFPRAPVAKTNPSSAEIPKKDMAGKKFRRHIFSLACDMEEPLDQALAFARTLDLMGFGLNNIADDHGPSFVAIAEALADRLTTAKKTWRQIMATSRCEPSARLRRKPRHVGRKKRSGT